MGPITPTAPQSETRTPEPARCGASSLRRPACGAGKLECGRRKGAEALSGTRLTPPASQGSAPWEPFLKPTTDSRPPPTPTGAATNHQPEHWRGLGLLSTRALTTSGIRKRGRTAAKAPARGSENTAPPLAAGGNPSARAPPSGVALTSTAFPTGPASAANGGLWPHLHQLLT